MNQVRSKKNKDNKINKTELWNVFDAEIVDENKNKIPLECLYREFGDRESCE